MRRIGVYQVGNDDDTVTFDQEFGKLAELTGKIIDFSVFQIVGIFELDSSVAISFSSGGSCWLSVPEADRNIGANELMNLTQGLVAPCPVVDTVNGHVYELPIKVLWSKYGMT